MRRFSLSAWLACGTPDAGVGVRAWTREAEMNAVWIPIGSAVAIILLSLGVLDIMSERVRVDQSSAAAVLDPPDDFLTLEFGPTVGRETPETTNAADGDNR
jgi:hypothetical protein